MDTYKSWVRQNRHLIAPLESIANTLTWFLPERFSSSEIGPEAVAAILGLVTVINQHIVDTTPQFTKQVRHSQVDGMPAVVRNHQEHLTLSLCLSAVKELEVLIEVAAEYYEGRNRKWSILAAVEAIKACLRFLILHQSGYHMLIDGGETRHVQYGSVSSHGELAFTKPSSERQSCGRQVKHFSSGLVGHSEATINSIPQNLERKATLALIKFGERAGVNPEPSWLNHSQSVPECATESKDISCTSKPTSFENWDLADELSVIGEWIFILRPLLYVVLIRRYGLASWKPWLASFTLDVTGVSAILTAGSLKRRSIGMANDEQKYSSLFFSSDERQELKRRQLLWALYLMRDPFFSKYTRHPLVNSEKFLRPIPLMGSLGGKVVEFVTGIQSRYFYTSAS